MANLTSGQTNWLQGFWSYFQGKDRPTTEGAKQKGWDAAEVCAAGYGGGYT